MTDTEDWTYSNSRRGYMAADREIIFDGRGPAATEPLTTVYVDTRYETHDSGERSEFPSGMVRDTNSGKTRFDLLIPLDGSSLLIRWAELLTRGAEKYYPRNWEKASTLQEYERFRESAFRHFIQWWSGDVSEDHAAAVVFNIQGAEYVKGKLKGEDI